jgi:hypothetical protein
VVLSGNQALDPAGTASCYSYLEPEKSYGADLKNLRPIKKAYDSQKAYARLILSPQGAASTYSFAFLPG